MERRSDERSEEGDGKMKIDDAFRKIRLMRMVRSENGSSSGEADNAIHLTRQLMERFSMDADDVVRPMVAGASRPSWVYWQHLTREFGLELRSFGRRGSASLGGDQQVLVIKLDTGEWHVQRMSPAGWTITARNFGLDSLRQYLVGKISRTYTFSSR